MHPTSGLPGIHFPGRPSALTGRAARGLLLALLATALALVVAAPSVGQAQEASGVTIRAEAGFDGRMRAGRWTPVNVEIENKGVANMEGELRVGEPGSLGSSTRYVEEVVLPAGGRKRFTVYAMAPVASQELEVLLTARGRAVASTTARATFVDEEDLLVGVIGSRAGAYNLLTTLSLPGGKRETFVVPVAPDALPARAEALGAFDVIVLGGPLDAPLSRDRRTALEAWVADGGTLVLPAGNRDVDLTALPEALLPARPAGTRRLENVQALERLGGEALTPGAQLLVAESGDLSGRVLAEQDGVPLAVLGRYGMGHVLYLAFDPAAQPFASWSGTKRVWEELLFQALPASTVSPATPNLTGRGPQPFAPSQWTQSLYNAVAFLPSLAMPSANLLLGLIGGYILLVGPVNYLVLRRLRRASLAWVTVPALVLVFSSGTYFLALGSKGSDVQVNAISVSRWAGDTEWAHVDRFVGVFVPKEGDYEVGMPGGGLLAPLTQADYRYYGGPPRSSPGAAGASMSIHTAEAGSRADVRDAGKWTMQTLRAESVERAPRRLVADVYIEGDRLKGTVTNGTRADLEALFLGTGAGVANLGALAAGASAPVDVPLANTTTNLAGNLAGQLAGQIRFSGPGPSGIEQRRWERQSQAVRGAIEAAYEQTLDGARALLVGWTNGAPAGVTVDGKTPAGDALTILVQPVLPKLRARVSIPGGMLGARVRSMDVDQTGNTAHQLLFGGDRGRYGVGFRAGSIGYEMELPSGLYLERLAVQVPFDGAAPPQGVEVQVFRWETGDWETLTTATVSVQSGLPGPRGTRFPQPGFAPPQVVYVAPSGSGGPPTPTPARLTAARPVQSGGRVTVFIADGPVSEMVFTQALEADVGGDPARYVSASGLVCVRLVVKEGAAASQPVTLGTPTLALEGVAHGS